MEARGKMRYVYIAALLLLSLLFLFPVFIVLMNSFKTRFNISTAPFTLPVGETFAGVKNYVNGIADTGFPMAFFWSLLITVLSVSAIIVFTSMTAWFLVRVKAFWSKACYYLFLFSMIVPFQMVMFTMAKTANTLRLDNPLGLVVIYLGFGSGLSVFMFVGFIKSVPKGIEEAATIDGCGPLATFFYVVLPILKPTAVTVAILQTMWIWNDYLLPYLTVGTDYKTIPIAVQYLKGGFGSIDMGAMMAMLVLSILPVIVFYLATQKYIIKGIAAGAVKG